ncbi:hypothetical protein QP027_11095 [Corynebacterium breve]|uniref:Uncharacterized protein n=1 Tax=Corynebacterium breve TaxID=3049799 RepID=A0ABY8VD81_9CORY|nr:hypothetical protein [Corynebacterium breve]WIM67614.1 hypothetical protein QP027_11095 [Corynebacterium breve]
MPNIILDNGQSHPVPWFQLLNVQVHSRGGSDVEMELVISGENISANTAGNTRKLVTACPRGASISVKPIGRDDFPSGTSVSLAMTTQTSDAATNTHFEFPIARVDGLTEALLAKITGESPDLVVTARGVDAAQHLNSEAMTVLTALRDLLPADHGITGIELVADATASTARSITDEQLSGIMDLIGGVSSALGSPPVTFNGRPLDKNSGIVVLQRALEQRSAAVGNEDVLHAGKPDTLLVTATSNPRAVMMKAEGPSVCLVTGSNPEAERAVIAPHIVNTAAVVALDEALISGLKSGNQQLVLPMCEAIAHTINNHESRKR